MEDDENKLGVSDSNYQDIEDPESVSSNQNSGSSRLNRSVSSNSFKGSVRRRKGVSIAIADDEEVVIPQNLEEKRQVLNTLFGFKPFSNHVSQRPLEARSLEVRKLYESHKKVKEVSQDSLVTFPNVMWTILFGWWLAAIYCFVALLLFLTYFGLPYARLCWQLKSYFFWPFGKYIIRGRGKKINEDTSLLSPEASGRFEWEKNPSSPLSYIAKFFWFIIGVPFLLIGHAIVFFFCWESVILIPMAKVNGEVIKLMFRDPLSVSVSDDYPGPSAEVLLCTYQSFNVYYYKYSVGGMNVILVNLLPFVVMTLVLGYLVPEHHKPPSTFLFFSALLSIIPLAYYIGTAVSSVSAQTSLGFGAVLNATFGSVVELILYFTAISKGSLHELVQYSVTGSLLSTMLLLPGLSIFCGGLKWKEMKFNPVSTGVSSVLLILSVIGAFTPTIFYHSWGTYTLECKSCVNHEINSTGLSCSGCVYEQIDFSKDPLYINAARPLMYACSIVLPIAYLIGLLFTLKTHAYIFEASEEKGEGHDAPEWGKALGITILVVATTLFAFISEQLMNSLEPAIEALSLNQAFVGVFFLGTVSNAAEIINAVNFGLRNNVALSIEIGAAGTVQAALIQIPALVLFSAVMAKTGAPAFTLIFPTLNVFAIIFGVITVNYIYINGKTNYFEGAAILLIWLVFIVSFYFVPE